MQFIDLGAQQKRIRSKIQKRINNVLDHGKYIMGPEVFELEFQLAEYVGRKYCISCSSGTDALLISLMSLGIGKGDAVLTSPFTYIATAEVIALLGAEPIFLDIYPSTFNINIEKLGDAIIEAKKKKLIPKAIIPVNIFGLPARYRLIEKESKKYNLYIIEDAAQSFGGSIKMKKSGSFGDISATSFFPAKPLGCYGDGGAIFTDNAELYEKMHSIRVHGGDLNKYDNVRVGINGRLDTIQAAILLEKLSIFDKELKMRELVAQYYIDNIQKYQFQLIPKQYKSVWAQFSLLLRSKTERKNMVSRFISANIPIMIYYQIPLHLQKVFRVLGYSEGAFPEAEKISKKIFSIPMHPYLEKRNQDKIIKILNQS